MGYQLTEEATTRVLARWREAYTLYAPVRVPGGGVHSGTDCVRYEEITGPEQIEWDQKSDYSCKEVLLPLSQTLFYYTEGQVREADAPEKGAVIFLRSCDLHAVRRLDDIYLENGPADTYYRRVRDRVRFVLMGCPQPFENCFCTDMGTNLPGRYDAYLQPVEGGYLADCGAADWAALLEQECSGELSVHPVVAAETRTRVRVPRNLPPDTAELPLWGEYDGRCIACGRCNFACPTCTCYTMQDIPYSDNGRAGERRRVHASCMVDGFTDMAGGHSYRQKNGQRMRYKVLHKMRDFHRRFGYHMCVGCGRCDDICPEYISFSACVNRLGSEAGEVSGRA